MRQRVRSLPKRARATTLATVSMLAIIAGWFALAHLGWGYGVVVNGSQSLPLSSPAQSPSMVSAGVSSHHRSVATSQSPAARSCVALKPHANVSNVLEDFELCFDEASCTGTLRFAHVVADQCKKGIRSLSTNNTLSTFLANTIGPDLFRFRLEGPESFSELIGAPSVPVRQAVDSWLAVSKAAPLKTCSYSITIPPLARRGEYQLGLEWLYHDYHAMDELYGGWPLLRKQSLLDIDPAFTTQYHRQQCTLPSTTTIRCMGGFDAETSEPRPTCNGHEVDSSGKWVRDDELAGAVVYTRVRVKKIQRQPIVFQWALQSDIARRWSPAACEPKSLSVAETLLMLQRASQRIVIGGDSQLRALYFALTNILSGHGMDCVRNVSQVLAEPRHCIANVKGSQRKVIQGVQVDFVDDLFLERFSNSERYSGYQTVVVGFAQHPASKEHWTFDRYRGAFQAKLRRVLQLKASGKLVVWYLAPQYPHTTIGFPVAVRDWRTDLRLTMFNTYAKQQCLAHGIPFVDSFSISTPFSHTSPDQAHFSNFVAFEFVRMLTSVIHGHYGTS